MIRIILFSVLWSLTLVKVFGQNPVEIQPISRGFSNIGEDSLVFEFEIKAIQEQLEIGWLIQNLPESSASIPTDLIMNYDGNASLKLNEKSNVRIVLPISEMGVPVTLLLHLISLDQWIKIPIPYLFQISELDVDTPGSDTHEFLEIIAPSVPFASLNGIEVTAINGSNERVSRRWDLSEEANIANEYGLFLIAGRDLVLPSSMQHHTLVSTSNLFQNGSTQLSEADAVSINWVISDLDQHFVLDALIYDTNAGSFDQELAELLQMSAAAVIEGIEMDKELSSLQKYPSSLNTQKMGEFFVEAIPTPGEPQFIHLGMQHDSNQWLMFGVPNGLKLIDWIEPSFYTQGAIGADIEVGDPVLFYWKEGAFVGVTDLAMPLPTPTTGFFIYGTQLTYGYGEDGWPKIVGLGLNHSIKVDLSAKEVLLEMAGNGVNEGLNLITNPFPIPIDLQSIFDKNDQVLEMAIWNPISKEYEVWNGLNGDLPSTKVPPFSAFWLKVAAETAITLEPNSMETSSSKQPNLVDRTVNNEELKQVLLKLVIDNEVEQKLILAEEPENLIPTNGKDVAFRTFEADQVGTFYVLKNHTSTPLKLSYINADAWNSFFEVELVIEGFESAKQLQLSLVDGYENNFDCQLYDKLDNTLIEKNGEGSWKLPKSGLLKGRYLLKVNRRNYSTTIKTESLPTRLALFQNYPNPFNPSTNFDFELKEASHIRLDIFDSLGQLIFTKALKFYTQGRHSISFNAPQNWQTGIYFYRLQLANGEQLQRKMTLIK